MEKIYVLASSLVSSLGNAESTFKGLISSQENIPLRTIVPDSLLLSGISLGETPTTKSELLAATLISELLTNTNPKDRENFALIIGNTNSGVAESVKLIKEKPSSNSYRSIELGATSLRLAKHFGIGGANWVVSTACTAGLKAICDAARLISLGKAKFAIAGGLDVESPLTNAGFSSLGARTQGVSKPFCVDRNGMHLGEGGAFLLLSSEKEAFGLKAFAQIVGWAETSDAYHISAPHPDGIEVQRAIKTAIEKAKNPQIDFIAMHGTATLQNDAMESKAIRALGLDNVAQASLKGRIGHTLGGAGAINAAICCKLIENTSKYGVSELPLNYSLNSIKDPLAPCGLTGPEPQTHKIKTSMANAFAFGGSNVTVIFSAPN